MALTLFTKCITGLRDEDTSTDLAELYCLGVGNKEEGKNTRKNIFMAERYLDWLLYLVDLLFSVTLPV
jgi:hypothetical protein